MSNKAFREHAEAIQRAANLINSAPALLEALIRVTMWEPRSTEAACEQDYEYARKVLARFGIKRQKPGSPKKRKK